MYYYFKYSFKSKSNQNSVKLRHIILLKYSQYQNNNYDFTKDFLTIILFSNFIRK